MEWYMQVTFRVEEEEEEPVAAARFNLSVASPRVNGLSPSHRHPIPVSFSSSRAARPASMHEHLEAQQFPASRLWGFLLVDFGCTQASSQG